MIEVQLPDGRIAEFPPSMSKSEIEAVLARQFGAPTQADQEVVAEARDQGGDLLGQVVATTLATTEPRQPRPALARDLPEIGTAPQLNQLSVDALKNSLAATLITNEDELAGALQGNIPGSQVTKDPEGRSIITMPDGEQFAVNKPGLSPQDVVQFASRALAFTPVGRGISGASVPALAQVAGRSAAVEGALQGVEASAGGEFDPEQAAIAAVAAPVGQIAGERVIAPVVRRALSPGNVQDAVIASAPSVQQLRQNASNIYDQIDEIGVRVRPRLFRRFVGSVSRNLRREGLDQDLTPQAAALVRRLESEIGDNITVSRLDTLRKIASGVAGDQNPAESRLGTIALDNIDDFIENVGPQALQGSGRQTINGQSVGQALSQARNNWGRARRAELIQQAFEVASDQASGFENGLRVQFRSLLKRINTGKLRGFSQEEIQALRTVSQGTTLANTVKQIGKLGIPEDQATNSLMLTLVGTLGGGIGLSAGGLPGGLAGATAAIGIPTIFRRAATNITNRNARLASAIVRSDNNAENIISAYLSNTPRRERTAADMAALLFNNRADLSRFTAPANNRLINDAVWAARTLAATEAVQSSQEPKILE